MIFIFVKVVQNLVACVWVGIPIATFTKVYGWVQAAGQVNYTASSASANAWDMRFCSSFLIP